jgi:AraC family transcriptional regulator of adaptative response / DNA-3-methyladenine glycosylase II
MRRIISEAIAAEPDMEVAGQAINGLDALLKVEQTQPDVVTLDVEMPEMDGLAALRHLMARYPRPVIMLSSLTQAGAVTTIRALTIGAVDLRDLPSLLSRVRRLLDLDADPVAIDVALGADPRLAPAVTALPGMRMPGAVDPQELLVRAMIGQQITVAAARTALHRLSVCGSESMAPADGLHRLFPTAAQIEETGFELLRGPQRRIDSVRAASAAMASGDLEFGYGDDLAGLQAKLLPLPGVGAWTVGYVAMRVIGAPDVFLANDAAVRNGIRALDAGALDAGPRPGVRHTPDFTEVSPWRSYATMHLWRAAAGLRPARRADTGQSFAVPAT